MQNHNLSNTVENNSSESKQWSKCVGFCRDTFLFSGPEVPKGTAVRYLDAVSIHIDIGFWPTVDCSLDIMCLDGYENKWLTIKQQ